MCTVSWLHVRGGYELFCNRDEKHTRSVAASPRVLSSGQVRYIASLDGDFGGTWLSVNEFGVTVCLLNGAGGSGRESRGKLVLELADSSSTRSVRERLQRMALRRFHSFSLVALEPGQTATICTWNGHKLTVLTNGEHLMPLVSSSFRPDVVARRRKADLLRRIGDARVLDSQVLDEFHHGTGAEQSAYSVCMHRDDVATVSFSRVSVIRSGIEFAYTPGPPCRNVLTHKVRLSLPQEKAA